MAKEPVVASSSTQPIDWLKEISDSFKWLQDHAWPVGGSMLLLAMIYMHQFMVDERLPLDVTSLPVFAMLLPMLGIIAVAVAVIVALIMLPTWMLFTPLAKHSHSLLSLMNSPATQQHRRWSKRILLRWLGLGALTAGACSFWLFLVVQIDSRNSPNWLTSFGLPVFSVSLALLHAAIWWRLLLRNSELGQYKKLEGHWDFRLALLASSLFQILVVWSCFFPALSWAQNHLSLTPNGWEQLLYFYSPFFLIALAVSLAQLMAALYVADARRSKRPLLKAGIAAMLLLSVLGMMPPTASTLVGYALGTRECVIMEWNVDTSGVPRALLSEDAKNMSVRLRRLSDGGDTYFVRPFDASTSKKIYRIPHSAVAAIGECPPQGPA